MSKKVFETAQVDLKVRGQHYFQHPVDHITPAEFLLLQDLHGAHSVAFLKKMGPAVQERINEYGKMERKAYSPNELREKLILKFGEKRFKSVFPSKLSLLPWTFDEIGVGVGRQGFAVDAPEAEAAPDEHQWEEVADDASDLVGGPEPAKKKGKNAA